MAGINLGKINKDDVPHEPNDIMEDIICLVFKGMFVEIGIDEELFEADEYSQSKEYIDPIEPCAEVSYSEANQNMRGKMCIRICIEEIHSFVNNRCVFRNMVIGHRYILSSGGYLTPFKK